jgi:hypothetical protein
MMEDILLNSVFFKEVITSSSLVTTLGLIVIILITLMCEL